MDGLYPCLCCLHESCVAVRLDKKGRPYTKCRICTATTFMTSELSLRGLWFFAPQVMKLLKQQFNPDELDERTREFFAANQQPEAKVG